MHVNDLEPALSGILSTSVGKWCKELGTTELAVIDVAGDESMPTRLLIATEAGLIDVRVNWSRSGNEDTFTASGEVVDWGEVNARSSFRAERNEGLATETVHRLDLERPALSLPPPWKDGSPIIWQRRMGV